MPRAFLAVDVQHAFREGAYQAFDVERVIANINRVSRGARAAGLPVFFIQHEAKSGPFTRGSPGWKFANGLEVAPGDHVVAKQASDAFHETGLADLLRSLHVSELIVCGIQSDFCVDSTVRRALALGFNVRLVQDALTTIDNGVLTAAQITAHHVKTLTSIGTYPGKAVACTSGDALAS